MIRKKYSVLIIIILTGLFFIPSSIPKLAGNADEGMWTFDNPPLKQLKERYGFTPSQDWLDHVRLSSVRFMDGGSGSFISPHGLVLTNHHVAVGQLQKISSEQRDYVATSFLAARLEEELKCPDLEINILLTMENVTDQIRAAIQKGMNEVEALKARRAVIARIEKESMEKTGLRSNIVSLYQGGEYWLYCYKKYTDVRLVMAPERQAAYFGGDFDNFTYPRYDLDMAFFRVYENDKPINSEHYLKWNSNGFEEGDLVFVSGNPGSTDRLYTFAQLENQRDVNYPMILEYIEKYIHALRRYSQIGTEQERRALTRIFGLENAKKALSGEYKGLLDPALMEKHQKEEDAFRKSIASQPDWQKKYGDAWDKIAIAIKLSSESSKQRFYSQLRGSQMAGLAQQIVRLVEEIQKPDAERLPGYHDSEIEELKFYLFSPAPIYTDLEKILLQESLTWSLDVLGPNDEFIKLVLSDKDPADIAEHLIENSRMNDHEFRKSLIEGGKDAVKNCGDPLIILARKLDPMLRETEKWIRENIESVLTSSGEKIAQARFAVYGKSKYPDATFTLRLSYGAAKGYPMNGTKAPYKTTLYGLFDRSLSFDKKGDFQLPQRFWDRKNNLDLSTPVNFVSTCDIIGGNSGSPVVNKNAEIVGVIFDGNIESLSGRFVYDETLNRAVAVHSACMIETLRKLYDASQLADEIENR